MGDGWLEDDVRGRWVRRMLVWSGYSAQQVTRWKKRVNRRYDQVGMVGDEDSTFRRRRAGKQQRRETGRQDRTRRLSSAERQGKAKQEQSPAQKEPGTAPSLR